MVLARGHARQHGEANAETILRGGAQDLRTEVRSRRGALVRRRRVEYGIQSDAAGATGARAVPTSRARGRPERRRYAASEATGIDAARRMDPAATPSDDGGHLQNL